MAMARPGAAPTSLALVLPLTGPASSPLLLRQLCAAHAAVHAPLERPPGLDVCRTGAQLLEDAAGARWRLVRGRAPVDRVLVVRLWPRLFTELVWRLAGSLEWRLVVAGLLRAAAGAGRCAYACVVPVEPCLWPLDYKWYFRLLVLLNKSIILGEAMAWLSTLGGGFSSLGDHFADAAMIAGAISFRQMTVAMEMGDPVVQAKCRLWYAQSRMQTGGFREAARIIRLVHRATQRGLIADVRVEYMCLGLWERLRYLRRRSQASEKPTPNLYSDRRRLGILELL